MMSTRSYIGIKEGEKVRYIYCQSNGYLSYNGVILNMFYRNPDKVKQLLEKGYISSLGYNLDMPFEAKHIEKGLAFKLHLYNDIHIKTSFVLPFTLYGPIPKDNQIQEEVVTEYSPEGMIAYAYLFDTDSNKWYATVRDNGVVKLFELDRLFSDKNYLTTFYTRRNYDNTDEEIEEDFNNIQEFMQDLKNEFKRPILDVYNEYLVSKGINDIEFCYAKDKNGKQVFAASKKLKSYEKRRKILVRSACIGKVLNAILEYKNVSFF